MKRVKITFIMMTIIVATFRFAECENVVYKHPAPDPAPILEYNGYYYTYTTTPPGTNTIFQNLKSLFHISTISSQKKYIPILKSENLYDWKKVGYAFNFPPVWSDGDVWAPDVVYFNHKFILYYAAKIKGTSNFGVGVAFSNDPNGPFIDLGHPIVSGKSFEVIDPDIFFDGNKMYLLWGSDFGPIYIQELSKDGTKLTGQKRALLWPSDKPYERLIEGAFLIHTNRYYYLFYCGDNTWKHYAEMVARSKNLFGPYEKYWKNPILKSDNCLSSPGGASLFKDKDGRWWIVYHAYLSHDIGKGRVMMLKSVVFEAGWPKVKK